MAKNQYDKGSLAHCLYLLRTQYRGGKFTCIDTLGRCTAYLEYSSQRDKEVFLRELAKQNKLIIIRDIRTGQPSIMFAERVRQVKDDGLSVEKVAEAWAYYDARYHKPHPVGNESAHNSWLSVTSRLIKEKGLDYILCGDKMRARKLNGGKK